MNCPVCRSKNIASGLLMCQKCKDSLEELRIKLAENISSTKPENLELSFYNQAKILSLLNTIEDIQSEAKRSSQEILLRETSLEKREKSLKTKIESIASLLRK